MKILLIIVLLLPIHLSAQIEKSTTEKGEITIVFEEGIEELVNKHKKINNSKKGIEGFRLQIAFASKKEDIKQRRLDFIGKYPDIPIYLTYTAPYYKLRIGNFRNKLQAEKMQNKIRSNYPGVYVVTEIIPFSELSY